MSKQDLEKLIEHLQSFKESLVLKQSNEVLIKNLARNEGIDVCCQFIDLVLKGHREL